MSDLKRISVADAWKKARARLVGKYPNLSGNLERTLRRTPTHFERGGWVFAPRFGEQTFVSFDGEEVKFVYRTAYAKRRSRENRSLGDIDVARAQLYGQDEEYLTPSPTLDELAEDALQRTPQESLFPSNFNAGQI